MENRLEVGVDIENIDRFTKLVADNDRNFFDKIYTREELDYCFSKKFPAQHLAARFAGKEAVIKALNCAGKTIKNYKDIEITNNQIGVPQVKIASSQFIKQKISISLSHCKDKAIAFCCYNE